MLAFTVPGPPVPKQRARRGKGGRWHTPEKTRRYEKHVHSVGKVALWADPVAFKWPAFSTAARMAVTLAVYFPDARHRDVDNVIKSVLDGLNGAVWNDDRQVQRVTAEKRIDRDNPRVEVTVEVME